MASPCCRTSSISGGMLAALAALAVSLWAADGPGQTPTQFSERAGSSLLPGSPVVALAAGDVDGDGDIDLVVQGSELRVYRNDGRGAFSDAGIRPRFYNQSGVWSLALGDLDGDLDLDLVVGKIHAIFLYLNDGRGGFTYVEGAGGLGAGRATYSLELADVDRDGDLDVLAGSADYTGFKSQQNRLFLNDGRARFTDVTATHLPVELENTLAMAVGDVDLDGDLDVVVGNADNPNGGTQNRLHLNDGTGRFVDATAARLPTFLDGTGSLALGDVNGDGDLDLVISNAPVPSIPSVSPQNRLLLNDGTGRFADVTATHMPVDRDPSHECVLLDVDLDRDLDLIFGNRVWMPGSGADTLYLNDGSGQFTDASAARLQPFFESTWALLAADVDGDGDPDLAAGGFAVPYPPTGHVRVLTNLYRHVEVRAAPRVGQSLVLDLFATPGFATGVQLALPWLAAAPAAPPIRIAPFGTLRLDPSTLVASLGAMIAPSTGTTAVTFPVPNDPRLVGRAIYAQVGFLHTPSPADWRFSNLVRAVVQ